MADQVIYTITLLKYLESLLVNKRCSKLVSCNFLVDNLTSEKWESDVIFLKTTNCLLSMGITNEVPSYGNNLDRSVIGMS